MKKQYQFKASRQPVHGVREEFSEVVEADTIEDAEKIFVKKHEDTPNLQIDERIPI
jgi:hypothetical protein